MKYDEIKTAREAWTVISRLRKIRRIPELEHLLSTDPNSAYNYAYKVLKSRWHEAEPIILERGSANTIVLYAKNIIKGEWPEAESKILNSPNSICEYAAEILKRRWPKGEKVILENETKDFEGFESRVHFWDNNLMLYCKRVVQSRWPEAEKILSLNPCALKEYAEEILEDKLPEELHNIMIANSLVDNQDRKGRIIQEYFEFVKETEKRLKKQLANRNLGNMSVEKFLRSL